MNPQSATVGVRLARKLNALIVAAATRAPDRVSFCGGLLSTICGAIAGLVGPQTAAELLRIVLGQLERQPQLELPPGIRLQLAAAEEEAANESATVGPCPLCITAAACGAAGTCSQTNKPLDA